MVLIRALSMVGTVLLGGCSDGMPASCEQLLNKTEYLSQTYGSIDERARERLEISLSTIKNTDVRDAHCRNVLNAIERIERR